jgi:hypothetical protein
MRHMRQITTALFIAALAACSNRQSTEVSASTDGSASVTRQELGRAFEMKIGDAITLNDMRVTFKSVDGDSRCPSDVYCVWAGDAAIALKLEQGSMNTIAALHTNIDPKKFGWNGYTISLVSLAPVRKTTDPVSSADYRAEIVITR